MRKDPGRKSQRSNGGTEARISLSWRGRVIAGFQGLAMVACVPTPRPRDVGKESPSSKTQRKSSIRGSASTKASCGRAKWSGRGHPMSNQLAESAVRSRCDHSEVEDLGTAGVVEFYRCTRCRDVVVVQGSRRWALTRILED